jgi:hypothetical protein
MSSESGSVNGCAPGFGTHRADRLQGGGRGRPHRRRRPAKGCPLLADGGDVEVYATIDM